MKQIVKTIMKRVDIVQTTLGGFGTYFLSNYILDRLDAFERASNMGEDLAWFLRSRFFSPISFLLLIISLIVFMNGLSRIGNEKSYSRHTQEQSSMTCHDEENSDDDQWEDFSGEQQ